MSNELTKEKIDFTLGSFDYLIFPEDNEYLFFQDHWYLQNIPSDVKFFVRSYDERSICFIGDGYGIQIKNEYGLTGNYGNGAIYVYVKNLPENISKWCSEHVLTTLKANNQ